MMKTLARLGDHISTERNFLRASVVGMGVPAAAIGVWAISSYGAFVAVVTGLLAFIGAYVAGLIMWRVMFRDIYARIEVLKAQAANAKRGEAGAPASRQ